MWYAHARYSLWPLRLKTKRQASDTSFIATYLDAQFQLHLSTHKSDGAWLHTPYCIASYISLGGPAHTCDVGMSWELELCTLKATYATAYTCIYLFQCLTLKEAVKIPVLQGLVRSLSP